MALSAYFMLTTSNKLDKKSAKVYVSRYKDTYVKPYLEKQGYSYEANRYIDAKDIINSSIFDSFDNQGGNDLITGNSSGVSFKFSDLWLEKDTLMPDGDMQSLCVFRGIFFMADFSKNINSNTYILSKKSKNLPKIPMDNVLFNSSFNVYSDNIQNAMYLITPNFMDKVLSLKNQFENSIIDICFKDSKIYIAIENFEDNFEPDIAKDLITNNPINDIVADLGAVLDIVKLLNLDRNIWINLEKNKI